MMNLTRCSKTATALLCVALLVTATGTAAALTLSSDGVPSEAQVGEEVSMTYTIDDPFTDTANDWTLVADTELQNVRWTVTVLRAGTPVEDGETTYGEQSFEQDLSVDNNGDQIQIELVGEAPAVANYSYDPEQTFTVAALDQRTGSNTDELVNDSAHHYTSESQAAREAIDEAQSAIDAAGGHQDAEDLLDSAISSYENENFENAQELAAQSQNAADSARQSQQTTQMILMGAGVLVVLLLLGGGIYYWQSQQGDDFSKL
ncbi:hypothetical protein [Halomicrobium sp. LC1Hm]|uniref:hypothetical protein n=1 Tax=Halomicrobium sp. LC1Hm TaxID=2610902 RepID=UPI0021006110|nr:hypothetical protein [Halomicrobium sp. LC1Hm]